MAPEWHDDDEFWATFAPVLFGEQEWNRSAAELDGVLGLAGVTDGVRVLDLCCGPGRHSLELARRGYRVTGVDRTVAYLARARAAAADEDLAVELVEADMREFARPEAFELALSLYTCFGYFRDPAEDRSVLANLYSSLRPGGALVMELMGKEVLARMFQKRHWERGDDGQLLLQEHEIRESWGWIENRWILVDGGDVKEFCFGHRLYSATELAALLGAVGFEEVEIYGDVNGEPYDHVARRLVVVARKSAEL